MKTTILVLSVLFLLFPLTAMAEEDGHGVKTFKVQAMDFSDPLLETETGTPCAEVLAYLRSSEKYKLLATAGIAGPPGVVYTLENDKGDIAIFKCGSGGCSHGDDGGHEEGTH